MKSVTIAADDSLKTALKKLYASQDLLPRLIDDEALPEQRIGEYYVELQILLDSKEDKQPIEMKDLFNKVGDQQETGKVLIVGGPGVGKSTLLHRLSYDWGLDTAFADRFDYVFRVDLKNQTSSFLEEAILDTLRRQQEQLSDRGIRVESRYFDTQNIKEVLDSQKAKVLLLLDGYDEISHLTYNARNPEARLIKQIFSHPNVVVTSRPNAVNSSLEQKFARKIEGTGLDQQGARDYIDKYFTHQEQNEETAQQKAALLDLYSKNQTLQSMLSTPLNVTMICLVSSAPDFTEKFGGDFNIGQLYEEIIVWLGKRYLTKFDSQRY
jgi:hypothetical protein